MVKLEIAEIRKYISLYPNTNIKFTTFIETGTNEGHTIFAVEPYFEDLHTIELMERLYKSCVAKNSSNKIHFYLGDSSQILPEVVKSINKPVIFWLDGHWSGGKTARGEKDCPLIEELKGINENHTKEAIIIIDDYRMFGTNANEDWTEITETNLLNVLDNERCLKYFANNDRFIIFLGAKN